MMTRRTDSFVLTLLMAVALMAGCGRGGLFPQLGEDGRGLPQALVLADSLMNSRPDSALAVLEGAEGDMAGEPKSVRMRYQLLRHQAMNKAFVPFTSDSLMLDVADYYDRHGTPNNRMLAHYLLGCVYRDLKEVPHAIDCFKEAITQADTTSTDYDIQLLGCVYSQMAWLYHQQLLLTYEIEARRKAMRYAHLSNDTLNAIYEQMALFGAYYLSNKSDSAEMAIRQALSDYQKYGFAQEALDASTMLMLLLTEQPNKLQELKQLIDNYDRNSINFNENHDLPPIHRQFYYYKGKYFESVNQLDSAEHYYRKVYHPDMRFVDNDPMYRGLLSVFRKCHIADSIAKYAQLYCMVNDSSIAVKDQHLTAQLAASYDYNYYQYQAFENERKAYRNGLAFVISLFGSLIIVGVGIYLGRIYKKKQEQKRQRMVEEHRMAEFLLKEEFLKAKNEYTEKIEDLQQLEETYRLACHDAQQTLSSLRTENESFRNENAEKQQALEKVSMMYEQEKTKLIEDINTLTKKIDELKSNEAITAYLGKSQQLADTSIVTLLKELEKDPRKIMTKSQYNEFEKTVCNYYPDLVYDLRQTSKLTMKDRQVCLLTALNFRPGTIANLASLSSSQVTNAKAKINMQLFNDPSAMTLYANLTNRYDICPS